MSLPRYPEYRESGVEWLGSVPAHWQIDRLKAAITSCKNGIWGEEPKGDGSDIDCVRVADFDRVRLVVDGVIPTQRSVTQSERSGRSLQRGDLLLEKSGGGEKQPVGQVVLYDRDEPAICSNFVARVTLAGDMVPRFWMYQHAAAYACGVNVVAIKQTSGIQNLDQSQYFDERGVFPPHAEQVQIARFLDQETAKIDALIAEQEKLMALLAEKRQATISHAVTRGLDPSVPMKDSGIPWLGEVPAHWEVMALGRITTSKCDGPFGSGLKSDHYVDAGARVIRLQNIRGGRFDDRDAAFIDIGYFESEMARHAVNNGDLLIAGLGDDKNVVGRACVAPVDIYPALVKADCFRFQLDGDRAVAGFVAWALTVGAAYDAGILSSGSTRSRIPLTVMATRKIPLPPINEQIEISRHIEAVQTEFDQLMVAAQGAIKLLLDRRSALIAAAVTGQIDVRSEVEAQAA